MDLQIINFSNKNNNIKKIYLCKDHKGSNTMPAIKWNKVSNAKSYAIIFEDLNAKSNNGCNFIHLYIKYINKTINSIDKLKFDNKTIATLTNKLITKNIIFGKNHTGLYGYFGPCNPHNYIHEYVFHIYALNNIINDNDDTVCSSSIFEDKYKKYIINKDSKKFNYIQGKKQEKTEKIVK